MKTEIAIAISQKAQQVIKLVKGAIATSPTGVSFFSVKNYTNKQGETSNYIINVGVNYLKAKIKDIEFLRNPTNLKIILLPL